MAEDTLRVVGYARTAVQDPDGIAMQVENIHDYCARKGTVLVDIVTVCGGSGLKPFDERGGRRLKDIILREAVDLLITRDLSRLGRDDKDVADTMEWLERHDVQLVHPSEDDYRHYPPGWFHFLRAWIKWRGEYLGRQTAVLR